ncbi:MurR/RpiR family transcriptional regulator [Paenibacillus sp. KQZ6P-2]|uniref:MurR/RpiR family transcriptional regulator n=1 Tax=Paenibacillus mangrovi TaxID=2931978 RepID=A0A9X1WU29_9BACL|nr:MurR/RpiR family transcriptional regulator [Paenibacillus mangrovi]MCJ8013670.1 MurR/RpiR family transcriptional regulator [Paenibacillus mangrovi]
MSDALRPVQERSVEGPTLVTMIQNAYENLSVTEKRIADLILNSPETIIYNTVTQVAEVLEVAQSTVTRFCRTIDLRGYQELKIRLAQELERRQPAPQVQEVQSLPMQLANNAANSILDAAAHIEESVFESAVAAIVNARRIHIFGLGESGPMAQLLKIKLLGLGLMVDAQVDIHLQSIAAAHLDSRDVAIGISQQGSTKDIVAVMQTARKSGAKTICITGHGKSPITEVSDISLVCFNRGLSNILESFKSKASILYVIELLSVSLTLQMSDQSLDIKKLWKTTDSILDKLY